MFVVCRFELSTPLIGPFETEEDALAWQDADTKKNGYPGEFSVWELFAPCALEG